MAARKRNERSGTLTLASLLRSAQFQLARRSLTTAQLKRLLERKAARALPHDEAPAWIDDVIGRCTRSGLLDDERVAAARAASLRSRGKSARAIAAKLRTQGVAAPPSGGDESELEAARVYVRKRRLLEKDPQKALAALARQGFSYAIAKKALEA